MKDLENKIKERTADYKENLNNWLQDPELQIAYLSEILKEEDIKLFLIGLQDVLEARCCSMNNASKK